MKHLLLVFAALILTHNASATVTHDGPAVYITKDENVEGRRCDLKTIIMHTKGNAHANEVGHRLVIELRKPRGSYIDCPASVAMNVESRGEVMKLYELVKSAKKIVCLSSTVVSGAHVNMTCDGAFEIRNEM